MQSVVLDGSRSYWSPGGGVVLIGFVMICGGDDGGVVAVVAVVAVGVVVLGPGVPKMSGLEWGVSRVLIVGS